MIRSRFPFVALAAIALLYGSPACAEAEHLGGGFSFDRRPFCERSAPISPITRRETAVGETRPGPFGGPSSRFDGKGGLLGGFLMGGLIGSFFRDDQDAAAPGLLDILVFGGGLLLIYRRLASRRTQIQPLRRLFFGARSVGGGRVRSPVPAESIPQDFDKVEFLAGAKAAYKRLLASWDSRNLEDIRQFTTSDLWEVIRRQMEKDPAQTKTKILTINAGLLDLKRDGDHTVAVVLFEVRLRERRKPGPAEWVQEIWHFSRKESAPDPYWRLKDIQQITEEIPA